MDDLQARRLEALSAHVEGLEAALAAPEGDGSLDSLRRLARSLARAADGAGLSEVASRARALEGIPEPEVADAARALLDSVLSLRPRSEVSDPGHRLLVVEDNATVAAAVMAYLQGEGRVLLLAASAGEAERLLAEHPIDLVILDLILPDRDGRDLLLQLREDPRMAGIPVIVLSARGGTVARAECLAVGASEFLEKPADPQALRRSVAHHLRDRRRSVDARVDASTGILSRAGLTEAYRALRSRKGKVESPLAVALLAVEPLDRVSATLGRERGERLVATVAEHLRSALGERDRLGRWTDAVLLALLPGTSPPAARGRVEEGLARLVGAGVLDRLAESGIELAFSIGVGLADTGADLREASFAAEQSFRRARREGTGIASDEAPRQPATKPVVLLVEDDRVTATLIQHRLVREGFEVMDFLNGDDAYRWASGAVFDLAILDVKVPGMDGFEILERLRAVPRYEHVPIIMLTGLGGEADVVRGLELGANDYMLKPFSPAELLARVRRLAESRQGRAAGAGTRGDASGAGAR